VLDYLSGESRGGVPILACAENPPAYYAGHMGTGFAREAVPTKRPCIGYSRHLADI